MKRVGMGLCFATALAASLAAQATQTPGQPPTSSQPGTRTQAPSTAAAGEMTLTGCLQKGADGNYTLTNVMADSSSGSGSATGTSGAGAGATSTPGASATGTSGAAAAAPQTWTLKGGADLANHVGHRISVTGARGSSSSSASAGGSTSGAAGATSGAAGATSGAAGASSTPPSGASGSAGQARMLEVSSVKMISATCP